jgi:riboflavin-specific deaminase-like protein
LNEQPYPRPKVTVHYAQTLDGRIATRTGQSQWIGGEASLHLAHRLRADHEAIMVGVGTVLADDPRLTVRLVEGCSPLRVVVDSTLRLPMSANVLCDGAARTLVATTARAPHQRMDEVRRLGVEVLVMGQDGEGRVDLHDLLRRLYARGVGSMLLEGGRQLITSALRARLVDRLVVCISPKVMGTGIEAVGDLGVDWLGEALTFEESVFMNLEGDIIFDGRLATRAERVKR